jgi:TonB family protein
VRAPRKLVSGNTDIEPTEKRAVIGTLRFCIGADGTVDQAGMYTSTGLADYDRALVAGARTWKYEPGPAETCDIAVIRYRPR